MNDNFTIDLNEMPTYIKGHGPVILVDDDNAQVNLMKIYYKKSERKNELICLESGEDLLKYCENILAQQVPMPEVVLLDVNMPQLDGFEILKRLRAQKEFEILPVIIMFTCSDSDRDKQKAQSLNANGFFSKPIYGTDYIKFFQQL